MLATSKFFPGALSIAFPQVTLNLVKEFFPHIYVKLVTQHNNGDLDLGISSSYNHAFAPMLVKREIEHELSTSLESFLEVDKRRNVFITVHIPECAISPTLLDVLGEIQNECGIRFVITLDSTYHNCIPNPYDIGRPNELEYTDSKGDLCKLRIMFSNNDFSRRKFSFPPLLDAKDVAFWYFTTFLESIAKPQPYPFWDKLKNGEDLHFVVHTDAETLGFHAPGREFSFFLFLHLLQSFKFNLITISEAAEKEPHVTRETCNKEAFYGRSWDTGAEGGNGRWMIKELDSSTQFKYAASDCLLHLLEELNKKKDYMTESEKQCLQDAEQIYYRGLTSCADWWWPVADSPAGKQRAECILESSERVGGLRKYVSDDKKYLLVKSAALKNHPFVKRTGIKLSA